MTKQLEIRWEEWLPPFDAGSVEGYTFADIKILVLGRIATELEDHLSQTLRRGIYVSAYPLALFLAANWWRLRWEPAPLKHDPQWLMRHSLAAIGEGYAWPDISFASDGEFILVSVRGTEYSSTSPVRYIADFAGWISAQDFERAVSECIEKVLARLGAIGIENTELEEVWKDVRSENEDTQASLWRRLEALAGYDPEEAPESFMRDLIDAARNAGWAGIQELAAASRQRAMEDLKLLQDAVRNHGTEFSIADQDLIAKEARPWIADISIPPWQRAYKAAQVARRIWSLDGSPLSNSQLAEIMGIKEDVLGRTSGPGSALEAPYSAGSRNLDQNKSSLVLNRKLVTSRRFAACRLAGDHLCDPGDSIISAATDAGTSRQKFQRAFAQELLCPIESLMKYLDKDAPSEDDIENAADHFRVSPLLVRTTLVNHRVLPRESIVSGD